jgi:recombination protein RecA
VGSIKDKEEVVGNQTRIKVVKNKVSPPFKVVDFDIMYDRGISKEGELVDIGVKYEFVEKSGAWFSYNGIRIGQGRENAKQFMRDNPQIASELEVKIKTHLLKAGSDFVIARGPEESLTHDDI